MDARDGHERLHPAHEGGEVDALRADLQHLHVLGPLVPALEQLRDVRAEAVVSHEHVAEADDRDAGHGAPPKKKG